MDQGSQAKAEEDSPAIGPALTFSQFETTVKESVDVGNRSCTKSVPVKKVTPSANESQCVISNLVI